MHFHRDVAKVVDKKSGNNYRDDDLISVDTIRVDDHLRVTLTRNLRKLFKVQEDDVIAIFENRGNNDLVLKIQRQEKVVETWILKKSIDLVDTSETEVVPEIIPIGNSEARLPKVMVIDDEPSVLLTFKEMLGDKFRVDAFKDSKEALEHFIKMNSSSYDIVITDIRMPSINGIQLYKQFKEIDRGIKIIFCSALDAVDEILSIFPNIKKSEILRKPVMQKMLVTAVDGKLSES